MPLLPASLRELWRDEALPRWVVDELKLPVSATLASLDGRSTTASSTSERIRSYVAVVVQSRSDNIRTVRVIDHPWPLELRFRDVPWRTRTKNCLRNAKVDSRLAQISTITFAELFDVSMMGVRSILDFACTLEAVTDARASDNPPQAVGPDEKQAEVSATLLEALDEPWASYVSERDPRFSKLLPAGRGTLTERIDQLTASPEVPHSQLDELAVALPAIRTRIAGLERLTLEDALEEYLRLLSKVDGVRLRALLARMHWDGSAHALKLEEAGAIAGVTRERVRQIQVRALSNMPTHPVVMPALDRALQALGAAVPLEVGEAGKVLAAERITRRPFHPASLIAAAASCGRAPGLAVEKVFASEMVVALPDRHLASQVALVAYKQAGLAGAGNVLDVAERLETMDIGITGDQARQLLQQYGGAEFLGEDWFWFPSRPTDFIRTLSRKMLSVTAPLDIVTMREGLKRAFRFRAISAHRNRWLPGVPPRDVLTAYYLAHPDFALAASGHVRPVTPLDYRAELGHIEQTVATVLRAAPVGVLDRRELGEACCERGVKASSLWTTMSYSPVVENLGGGLWTLRGTVVDPAAVDAIRKENALRPRERRVIDYGWTPDGLLWVAFRLPAAFETSVLAVPAPVGRLIAGRDFAATSESGASCGRIRVYDTGTTAGQAPFLRRAGADEGDILLEQFDLTGGTAILSLTDDEGLEDLSPET